MSTPEPQAASASRRLVHAPPTRGGLIRRLSKGLGRFGLVGATAIIVGVAVLAAEIVHALVSLIRGNAFSPSLALDIAIVTLVVATPIIILAQEIIRELFASRRTLKQMTEQLAMALDRAEQANQAKSQFLANMSHELRTPLNAIIGFSEMMHTQRLGPVGNTRYLEYVKDIHHSGQHLLQIINDILDLSKIESGQAVEQDHAEFDCAALVGAVARLMRPLAERGGVMLDLHVPATTVRIFAIERMVRQILLNILSNAIKFTPQGGTVALEIRPEADGALSVIVADTGLGMTGPEIKIALTPFGQVASTLSRKHSGTGLGLPLAKAMMELHGGSLAVASTPRQGTTVTLRFPAAMRRDGASDEPARVVSAA